ncbi:MAG: hypothetical protein MHM6MM_001798 [Cercozoa sp. M6MM]
MPIIVDGKDHVIGRLASVVAKELLQGKSVVVVRAEELIHGKPIYRVLVDEHFVSRKTMNTNPRRGPSYKRSPAEQFRQKVRGMLPYKTSRGKAVFAKLQVVVGCPAPYDKQKKLVVPAAQRVNCLRPSRAYCTLGDVCAKRGWKYQALVSKLEGKRKARSAAFYKKAKAEAALVKQAEAKLPQELKDTLAQFGY